MSIPLLVTVSIIGGLLTYYINHFTNRGPIFASGVVTLMAGLILPRIWPDQGPSLALAATCASYAGMAARSRIKTFRDMTLCSLLVAALFILTKNAFVGIGGKLGTIAGIAVISVWGVRSLVEERLRRGHHH